MIEHYIYSPPDNSSPDNMWYWKVADRVACFIKIGDELSEDKLSGASCQWMGCQRANSRRVYNWAFGRGGGQGAQQLLLAPEDQLVDIYLNLTSLSVENFADSLKYLSDDMTRNLSMAELMVM